MRAHNVLIPIITGLVATTAGCGDDGESTTTADASLADASADAGDPDAAPPQDPLEGVGPAELIQENFMFLEGPRWRASDGLLLFTDIPADTIFSLGADDVIEEFRKPSGNANGLIFDTMGRLLAAEHGNRRVSRTLADGTVETVVDSYESMRLNSPNDLAVRSDGTIYFTDPPYGLPGQSDGRELAFNGLFRVAPDGTLTAEWMGGIDTRPNGVVLSPDEGTLYVADTADRVVRTFSVAADGSLTQGDDFATEVPNPDGMAIDDDGNLYVTATDGVRVYAPDGSLWGTIEVSRQPANVAFGGADRRTLYITAREGLYRVSVAVPGLL